MPGPDLNQSITEIHQQNSTPRLEQTSLPRRKHRSWRKRLLIFLNIVFALPFLLFIPAVANGLDLAALLFIPLLLAEMITLAVDYICLGFFSSQMHSA